MVELRKRKTPSQPPSTETKSKKAKAPAQPESQGTIQGAPSNRVPNVGDTIALDGFGGEIETNDGAKTTLKKLVDESNGGVVLFTYPKASTPGCKFVFQCRDCQVAAACGVNLATPLFLLTHRRRYQTSLPIPGPL